MKLLVVGNTNTFYVVITQYEHALALEANLSIYHSLRSDSKRESAPPQSDTQPASYPPTLNADGELNLEFLDDEEFMALSFDDSV